MKGDFLIIDDYADDPDGTREYVLSCDFDMVGNYPGFRALPSPQWAAQERINLEKAVGEKFELWDEFHDPICFQWSHDAHTSWIHHDFVKGSIRQLKENGIEIWAGIHYLTPNAPIEAGTGLYRRKDDHVAGLFHPNRKDDSIEWDYPGETAATDEWELTAWSGNVYNRLLVYKAHLYHRNICGFGTNKNDARLTQVCFFGVKTNDS